MAREVPREIFKIFYTPSHAKSLSSRKSTRLDRSTSFLFHILPAPLKLLWLTSQLNQNRQPWPLSPLLKQLQLRLLRYRFSPFLYFPIPLILHIFLVRGSSFAFPSHRTLVLGFYVGAFKRLCNVNAQSLVLLLHFFVSV